MAGDQNRARVSIPATRSGLHETGPRSGDALGGLTFEALRASAYPLIDADEAATLVLEHTPVLGIERVALAHCVGRVLAEDLLAPASLPAFPASAVDGYAVRA